MTRAEEVQVVGSLTRNERKELEPLRTAVVQANLDIVAAGLVLLTWGNVSAVDRSRTIVAIKPSGVAYNELTPELIPLVHLETGEVVDGTLNPSSDTATHLELYRAFESVGAVVHTHSHAAVCFAQCHKSIPCLGTTHADHFLTDIPVTRSLRTDEIQRDYELNTGRVIVERFMESGIDAARTPGVLVDQHGPFAWGADTKKSVENAIVLEACARMALDCTRLAGGEPAPADRVLVEKHFFRKHGPGAYYGQSPT